MYVKFEDLRTTDLLFTEDKVYRRIIDLDKQRQEILCSDNIWYKPIEPELLIRRFRVYR